VATRKRVKKPIKKVAKRRKTTKEPILTKLDFWAIAAKEVYDACRKAGMDEGTALAFAMDRSSYPDWIVPMDDPIRKPDFDEDEDD
jgi:predicted metal-dependent phosphotriesterase family hydrolase